MTRKVAAFQAPLETCSRENAIPLIREQIARCEALGVEFLCCPEGMLGGLADYTSDPAAAAICWVSGQGREGELGGLEATLAPLASETVTTIVGFTEIDRSGRLYNAAAVYHRGAVVGMYRKLYPAIHRSVYTPGRELPVFTVEGFPFGILICLDSNYFEPARIMAARGAAALFIPTNNGLPPGKAGPELVALTRNTDIARAIENGVSVIRADVTGEMEGTDRRPPLLSFGATGIVGRDGRVLAEAEPSRAQLVVADVKATTDGRRMWNAAANPAVRDEYVRLLEKA